MINNISLFLNENILDTISKVLKDWNFWKVIISTFFMIAIGYYFLRWGIFKKEYEKCFITLVMSISLPALIIDGFLVDIDQETIKSEALILLISLLFHVLMLLIANLFFLKYEKDVRDVMSMAFVFAATTFFGMPLAINVWCDEPNTSTSTQIFNIPYRILLYSIGYFVMSNKKMSTTVSKKEMNALKILDKKSYIEQKKFQRVENIKVLKNIFINPILVCTIIGFILWSTQLIPGIKIINALDGENKLEKYSILRIDILFPPIKSVLNSLKNICTPITFLMIGMKLTEGNFREIIKNKQVWYLSILKCIIAPLISLLLVILVAYFSSCIAKKPVLNEYNIAAVVLMVASPTAYAIVSYSITYDRSAVFISNVSLLQVAISIFTMPIWIIIIKVVAKLMPAIFNS